MDTLTLLAFPQRWRAGSLHVRFVSLPRFGPRVPLDDDGPSFAEANLIYAAKLVPKPDQSPDDADAIEVGPLELRHPPVDKARLFDELQRVFVVERSQRKKKVPRNRTIQFNKAIVPSYRTLAGNRRLSSQLRDPNDFSCALHEAAADPLKPPAPLKPSVSWGRLMAYALRQPKLAMALGLIGEATIRPPNRDIFKHGGWLYIDLHASSDYGGARPTRYAARIPPLSRPRPVYAAALFPVGGHVVVDGVYEDAERYAAGFAGMVHAAQSGEDGDSIRLAWDDEKVAEWLDRQTKQGAETPMGTAGFRIDVKRPGIDRTWHSLQRIRSVGPLRVGRRTLGRYEGEAVVEVVPAQLAPHLHDQFWLPPYFATWRGGSLALTDPDLAKLHDEIVPTHPAGKPMLLGRERAFVPIDHTDVPLRYGQDYAFRVRLADLTRGGPDMSDPTGSIDHAVTRVRFVRRLRPGPVIVARRPAAGVPLKVAKSRLGYPHALFAGARFDRLRADFRKNELRAESERAEMTVPDPGVHKLEIEVAVRVLDGDVEGPYVRLYTTVRRFSTGELEIPLLLKHVRTLESFAPRRGERGIPIPSARHVRLTLTALGRPRDFADVAAAGDGAQPPLHRGVPLIVDMHGKATVEAPLFSADSTQLKGFFLQPPPDDGSVAPPPERLAAELGLDCSGLTISGRPRSPDVSRTVFACSPAIAHALSPERGAVTLPARAEVLQRWITAIQFTLQRDWTWNGLARAGDRKDNAIGIRVERSVTRDGDRRAWEVAGVIELPRAIAPAAVKNLSAGLVDRARLTTAICFLDAIDPKPPAGRHPTEITVEYRLQPFFEEASSPAPILKSIRLPIATAPLQRPQIRSAGIALDTYHAAPDYSATEPRRRALWIELDGPPLDPGDAYFVRVLANAPDPILIERWPPVDEVVEPALTLDPEWIREIAPNQPPDQNGLTAMQPLVQRSDSGSCYLVPVPEGMTDASPELFGMFTYEIRVGHRTRWSTAQARFGPPLRVAGVQHPAPPLVCQVARFEAGIRMRAPLATAVLNGQNRRPRRRPTTSLWGLLYARVRQIDGLSWRNLLLTRIRLAVAQPPLESHDSEGYHSFALGADAQTYFAETMIPTADVEDHLRRAGLPLSSPLTALAVEVFNEVNAAPIPNPLRDDLGDARFLRISTLVAVPDAC